MTAADARPLEQPDPFGCADEPIHIPGAVQPHGVLVGVTEADFIVRVVSANSADHLGRGPDELVGRPVDAVFPADQLEALRPLLDDDLTALNPYPLALPNGTFDAILHRASGLLLFELEPVEHPLGQAWYRPLRPALMRLQHAGSIAELGQVVAEAVRDLTGFDRVMVYRFDPAWNGEVIAETKADGLEPYLGLRYPATDIPAQARALYERQWLRVIPDARYTPSPLVAERGSPVSTEPVDLGDAVLRSVSPVHLEYLANMGVVASMSASLIRDGRLWGLVACHHYSGPLLPPYHVRTAVEFLAQATSVLLDAKEQAGDEADRVAVTLIEAELAQALAERRGTPLDALTEGSVTITDLTRAAGAAIRIGQELRLVGTTPRAAEIDELARTIWRNDRLSFVTDSLSVIEPRWEQVKDVASGVLGVRLGNRDDQYILWFRPEKLQSVSWGGDPTTSKVVEDERGVRLSPRRSFARYEEVVRQHSEPWADHEVEAALRLASHVSQRLVGLAVERDAVWATLQRTLLAEQIPDTPGFRLAARYFPGGGDVPVGGDWYDVVHLPNGHTAVVVGDVAGHGLAVAAVTAQFRHGLRAYVVQEASPAGALARLNELARWLLPDELVTVLVADLDPSAGVMRCAGAGHVPVLVSDDDGARYVHGSQGPALGLTADPQYKEEVIELAGDTTVVLFTDGLVEERGQPLDEGLRRVQEETAAFPNREPDALCDDLIAALGGAAKTDDVTLVAFRLSAADSAS